MDSKLFEWSSELELGISTMDNQHKVLVNKINALIDALNKGTPECPALFADMAKYVIIHFKDEEEYLQSINYPDFAVHKTIHEQLLVKVGEFQSQLTQPGFQKEKLVSFLVMWLRSHIMGIDMKYGKFIKDQAA